MLASMLDSGFIGMYFIIKRNVENIFALGAKQELHT